MPEPSVPFAHLSPAHPPWRSPRPPEPARVQPRSGSQAEPRGTRLQTRRSVSVPRGRRLSHSAAAVGRRSPSSDHRGRLSPRRAGQWSHGGGEVGGRPLRPGPQRLGLPPRRRAGCCHQRPRMLLTACETSLGDTPGGTQDVPEVTRPGRHAGRDAGRARGRTTINVSSSGVFCVCYSPTQLAAWPGLLPAAVGCGRQRCP